MKDPLFDSLTHEDPIFEPIEVAEIAPENRMVVRLEMTGWKGMEAEDIAGQLAILSQALQASPPPGTDPVLNVGGEMQGAVRASEDTADQLSDPGFTLPFLITGHDPATLTRWSE